MQAVIVSLIRIVTNLLLTNPYVAVISLDFSKAFNMVRHSTLVNKLAELDLPEYLDNWLVAFLSQHTHCTDYNGQRSSMNKITASIIEGSGIGPATYVVSVGPSGS